MNTAAAHAAVSTPPKPYRPRAHLRMVKGLEPNGYDALTRTFWAQCPHGCGAAATGLPGASPALAWVLDHVCPADPAQAGHG